MARKDKKAGKGKKKGTFALEYRPPDDELVGLDSIAPARARSWPGRVKRLLSLPFRIVAWPFKILGRMLRWLFRRPGRGQRG